MQRNNCGLLFQRVNISTIMIRCTVPSLTYNEEVDRELVCETTQGHRLDIVRGY